MLIVQHFLRDVEMHDGKYTGFPDTGFRAQNMENVGLRRAFGRCDADRDGILVQAVDATSDASRVLKSGDIVIALDDVPVSYSGTVPFREQLGERIDLSFLGMYNKKVQGVVLIHRLFSLPRECNTDHFLCFRVLALGFSCTSM